MGRQHREPDDETVVVVRVHRAVVAVVAALVVHGIAALVAARLTVPEPPPQRISIDVNRAPPPAPTGQPAATPSKPPPTPPRRRPSSPMVPVLPPTPSPPEHRARLPDTVPSRAPPSPDAAPSRDWKAHLFDALAETSAPPPRTPTGVLAPSTSTLGRVAAQDARLHDEETERRLQADHGPFFQRGIEALRRNWHPDEVLKKADARDPTKLCGRQTRTTYATAVIDRQGNVVEVDLRRSSGCEPLDEEAIAAFMRVARFPYPPAGLFVNPDGTPSKTARYPVRFIVTFDGRLRIDWP